MHERPSSPHANRRPHGPIAFALVPLALVAVFGLAACGGGGGGGGESADYRLVGKLRLQQESAPAILPGRESSEGDDAEPNDQLFSALDLGSVDEAFARDGVKARGRVGTAIDRRDVLRFGPVSPEFGGRTLRLSMNATAGRAVLHVRGGVDVPAREMAIRGETTIRIAADQDFVVAIESSSVAEWEFAARVEDATESIASIDASTYLTANATTKHWGDVLGGDAFRFVPGEVLVGGTDCRARLEALGFRKVAGGDEVARFVSTRVAFPNDTRAAQRVQSDLIREVRRALPDADWVSPNIVTPLEEALAGVPQNSSPNDSFFVKNEQFNLTLTNFPGAWNITNGSDDVHIAVVDTGMMIKHPDLAPRVSQFGYDFISDPKSAGDGTGIDADPSEPAEFDIYFFHGTYVGGIATAVTNNSIGIAGGTWKGKVIPIRVFGALGGTSYDRVQAYRYLAGVKNDSGRILAEKDRPKVINLSFAIPIPTAAEHAEIRRLYDQNVKMVAAIDNQGLDPAPPLYPAAWPEVLCCGAVDEKLVRTTYSNAADYLDICAPGGTALGGPKGVVTTWALRQNGKLTYVYNSFLGTSVATPAVTAALALMEAVHPGLEPELARRILAETCKDLGAIGRDRYYGHGLLQADAAVRRAVELNKEPVLALSPQSLRFGDSQSSASLSISNNGGRLLEDFSIEAMAGGSGAVSFDIPENAPADLLATLTRDMSLVGNHQESFLLRSNGGQLSFDLSWRRPIPIAPPSFEVWLSRDGRLVDKTRSATDGSFVFEGLAAGTYYLEAGVDRDSNGRLGDPQEWYLGRTVVVDGTTTGELGGVIAWQN